MWGIGQFPILVVILFSTACVLTLLESVFTTSRDNMNSNDARNHFLSKHRDSCFECKDELSSVANTGNESLNGSKLGPLRAILVFQLC